VFWLGGGIISLSFCMYNGNNDVRQTEVHTTESLVPKTSAFELKRHKPPGIYQIPVEF